MISTVVCSIVCVRAHAHVLLDRDEIFAQKMINHHLINHRSLYYCWGTSHHVYHKQGKKLIAINKHMRMRTHTDDRTRHQVYNFSGQKSHRYDQSCVRVYAQTIAQAPMFIINDAKIS